MFVKERLSLLWILFLNLKHNNLLMARAYDVFKKLYGAQAIISEIL